MKTSTLENVSVSTIKELEMILEDYYKYLDNAFNSNFGEICNFPSYAVNVWDFHSYKKAEEWYRSKK